MNSIEIKPLTLLEEMHEAVELQKVFWGNDLESIVPAHMLYSLATHGGHVLAAFDAGRMIGVLIDFIGTREAGAVAENLQLVSKRMVVLPEYRGQGVGFQLKCEQRKCAIEQGLKLVTWTFDPLISLNAYLNIHKLGGVCRTYLENYYGTADEGGLATLGASDRLLVEWWVMNAAVEARLNGDAGSVSFEDLLKLNTPIVNPTTSDTHGFAVPPEELNSPKAFALLEVPVNYPDIIKNDPELAKVWRQHTRALIQNLFGLNYSVTDFFHVHYEGRDRAFYYLEREEY